MGVVKCLRIPQGVGEGAGGQRFPHGVGPDIRMQLRVGRDFPAGGNRRMGDGAGDGSRWIDAGERPCRRMRDPWSRAEAMHGGVARTTANTMHPAGVIVASATAADMRASATAYMRGSSATAYMRGSSATAYMRGSSAAVGSSAAATAAAFFLCRARGRRERDDERRRYEQDANTGLAHGNFFPWQVAHRPEYRSIHPAAAVVPQRSISQGADVDIDQSHACG